MKVLQINTVYKTGSTGRITKDLNDLIIKQGWQSFVGFGRGEHNDKNIIKIGSKLDMYIHGVGTRIFDKHGLYSKKATIEFIKKIDKLNIDIFHLHNIHGYYLHYPTLFKYLKNKKVIWTLHDCWVFTGHCAYYEFAKCDKWQNECNSCPQKKRYPSSFAFDNSKQNFNLKKRYFTSLENLTIVAPSNWLAKEVKKSFLKDYSIKVINNGIDINTFKPINSDFEKKYNLENKFIILGVANVWEERKGFDYFIELSKIINNDEIIILVGLNDKQLKNLPKNIIGISRTDSVEELVEIYSSSDVFVNPTLEDNFPTTNIESLACGTPVITFDSGGSPEVIDEKYGVVVEKGNLKDLYQAVQHIKLKGFEKLKCRNKATALFDKNKNFEEYIELYKEII